MVLVVFDFDGTLSREDSMLVLGREYDVVGEVRGLIERERGEEQDVGDLVQRRARLFEGMPERRLERAFDRLRIRDDAAELIADLRRSGVAVGIVTTSFERGVEHALEAADVTVDHLVAPRLELANGAVAGLVEGPLIDGSKGEALQEMAARANIPLDDTIAIGNSVVDRSMLLAAGTSIGFRPAPVIEQQCDYVVTDLKKLRLYFEQHGIIESASAE